MDQTVLTVAGFLVTNMIAMTGLYLALRKYRVDTVKTTAETHKLDTERSKFVTDQLKLLNDSQRLQNDSLERKLSMVLAQLIDVQQENKVLQERIDHQSRIISELKSTIKELEEELRTHRNGVSNLRVTSSHEDTSLPSSRDSM